MAATNNKQSRKKSSKLDASGALSMLRLAFVKGDMIVIQAATCVGMACGCLRCIARVTLSLKAAATIVAINAILQMVYAIFTSPLQLCIPCTE
jgi:hypothetical protein